MAYWAATWYIINFFLYFFYIFVLWFKIRICSLMELKVQSELGDYDAHEMGSTYLKDFKFAPNQTQVLEDKVMELHKTHKSVILLS